MISVADGWSSRTNDRYIADHLNFINESKSIFHRCKSIYENKQVSDFNEDDNALINQSKSHILKFKEGIEEYSMNRCKQKIKDAENIIALCIKRLDSELTDEELVDIRKSIIVSKQCIDMYNEKIANNIVTSTDSQILLENLQLQCVLNLLKYVSKSLL